MRGISLSGAWVVAGIGCAAWAAGCSSSQSTGGSGGADAADDGTGGSDDGTSPSGDATNPSEGSATTDGSQTDVHADGSEASMGSDASDAANLSDTTTPGDGSNDAADAGSPYHAYCTAFIAANCGGNPSTVPACEGYLASKSGCPELATCIACAGSSPVASCNDAGPPHIVGCASSCDSLQCTSGDGGGGEGGGGGDGGGDAAVGCPGVQTFSGGGSADPSSPTPIPSGSLSQPIAILGPALPGGGGYSEFGGFFEVTGLTPNAVVSANIFVYPCTSGAACPTDISVQFGAFDAGFTSVLQSGSTCASGPVTADADGNLFLRVGKMGDSGAEDNVGLLLSAPPPTDGGPPSDAPSGG